ncbi:Uncharacterised protein [Vibrio cholerae]|nr:Uncharacterised protein [Vibrio cholerae]CSI64204.1 Uncharacterised protein [Vibrio cholerae]
MQRRCTSSGKPLKGDSTYNSTRSAVVATVKALHFSLSGQGVATQ